MFEQWLSTSAALGQNADEIDISLDEDAREKDLQALYLGRNPFLISWDWAMSYSRFKAAYATFIAEYLLNDAAVALLMRRLKENEYFKAADKEKEFDFIAGWEQWRQYYHQTLGLTEQHRLTWSNGLIPDGFTACMGSYTLRALAAGKITCNGVGKYTVTVVRTAVVIEDTFNFGFSDDDADQDYYFWSCQDLDFAYGVGGVPSNAYQNLYNSSFRQYRKDTGMGGDFQVLSSPHEVENFVEQSYAYQS